MINVDASVLVLVDVIAVSSGVNGSRLPFGDSRLVRNLLAPFAGSGALALVVIMAFEYNHTPDSFPLL